MDRGFQLQCQQDLIYFSLQCWLHIADFIPWRDLRMVGEMPFLKSELVYVD